MTAVVLSGSGAQLEVAEVPGPGQVLVQVQASSVNALDGGIAAGMFEKTGMPHVYPVTLGRSAAGVVLAVGRGVQSVFVGDRVLVRSR
jgi:NADPH2:quinone reductase